jgi:RNA polymerase sigma-B factor
MTTRTRSERHSEYVHLAPLFHRLRDGALPAAERRRIREDLVEGHTPLAEHISWRFRYTSQPADDLRQVALLGLVLAIDRFDPYRGTDFVPFAVPTITGELRRHFRDHTWSLTVPRRLKELSRDVTWVTLQLTQELGRAPRPRQVAERLDVSLTDVGDALQASHAYQPDSLTANTASWSGHFASSGSEHDLELAEHRMLLYPALGQLGEQESELIKLRFFDDLTQTQIGERLGVSQMQVSRMLAATLAKLRESTGGTD